MLLAVNIGNSRTNMGLFNKQGILQQHWSAPTQHDEGGYADAFPHKMTGVERILCASVVPRATLEIARQLKAWGIPLEVLQPREDLGLCFAGVDYRELGTDLFANALAVLPLNREVLNVDLGTASTFCVIKGGIYHGTSIVPGLQICHQALSDHAALLEPVPLAKLTKVIQVTTTECVQSGIYFGYLALVRGLIARILEEQGSLYVMLTGGIGAYLRDGLHDVIDDYQPQLTLHGIYRASMTQASFPTFKTSRH